MNLWYAACPRLPRGAYGAITFEPLDNGVLAVPIRKRPQLICDAQTGDKINALLRKWLRLLPDRRAGYRYDPRCSKSNSP
jgi:hypothetical protein